MHDVVGSSVKIQISINLCRLSLELSFRLFHAAIPAIVHGLEQPSLGIGHCLVYGWHEGIEEHSANKD